MLKLLSLRLRSSHAKRGGLASRADDVFAFFTSAPANGSVGLNEFAIDAGASFQTGDNDDEDVAGRFRAGPPVARIASNAQIAQAISSVYDPFVYAYGLFDYFTIQASMRTKMTNFARSRFALPLLSPYALVRHPRSALRTLGPSFQTLLSDTLLRLLAYHDAHARESLVRCVTELLGAEALADVSLTPVGSADIAPNASAVYLCDTHHQPSDPTAPLLVRPPSTDMTSFLRGLLLCSATHDPLTAQASFVLDALLDNGAVEKSALMLPGDYQDRCVILSDLLFQGSLEFGSEAMLNAALLLMHQSGQSVSLRVCKRICVAQCRAERRAMDWVYKSALPSSERKRKKAARRVRSTGTVTN